MTKKVKSFAQAATLTIVLAAMGTGIAAAPAAAKTTGARQTVYVPHPVLGCKTDEGYGRLSSCDGY